MGYGTGKDGGEGRRRGVPGEDVVGDGSNVVFVAEGLAEGEHESGFAGADRSRGCVVVC